MLESCNFAYPINLEEDELAPDQLEEEELAPDELAACIGCIGVAVI
jgi:hypothetical protein